MTDEQLSVLKEILLGQPSDSWFLHGDCIGADAQAAELAASLGYKLECFPANRPGKRAFVLSDIVHPEAEPLDRNWDLASGDLLIACPKQFKMITYSGTWSTVRRAIKRDTPYLVIFSDGTVGTV